MTRRTLASLAALAAALTLAACGSAVKLDDPAPVENRGGAAGAASGAPGAGAATAPAGSQRPVAQVTVDPSKDPLSDPNSPLAKRSIFFDFDSFTIKDEFRPVVEAHAKYLVANKARKVVVQGNTDERGSREYNLALGQKRSDGVKRMLMLLGAKEDQIESVSLGEEKPRAQGSSEDAWSQNRRSDMLYSGEF